MARASDTPRTFSATECDHLRPVVSVDGKWRHVGPDGSLEGECSAGVYVIEATYAGSHTLGRLVSRS
jgi:hypothetical protein